MDRSTNKNLDNQQSKLFIFLSQHVALPSSALHSRSGSEENALQNLPCQVFIYKNLHTKPLCIVLQRSQPGHEFHFPKTRDTELVHENKGCSRQRAGV